MSVSRNITIFLHFKFNNKYEEKYLSLLSIFLNLINIICTVCPCITVGILGKTNNNNNNNNNNRRMSVQKLFFIILFDFVLFYFLGTTRQAVYIYCNVELPSRNHYYLEKRINGTNSKCVCGAISYPPCKVNALYHIVICSLSVSACFSTFSHK